MYTIITQNWIKIKEIEKYQLLVSQWECDDGDVAELYIQKEKEGFELYCFSGVPASKIVIDIVDFGIMWRKAKISEPIQNYTYFEQCIILADWLCNIFCNK